MERVARQFTVAMVVANVAGAITVMAFLTLLLPVRNRPPLESALLLNAVFLVYLVAACIIVPRWGQAIAYRRMAWLLEGRSPTPAEQRQALRNSLVQLELIAGVWAVATLGALLINLVFSARLAFAVATGVLIGGLVTCAICYLTGERALRPVTARILEHGVPLCPAAPGVVARTVLAWALPSGVLLLTIGDLALSAIDHQAPLNHRTAWGIVFLAGVGLVAGAIAIVLLARSIAEPVRAVRRGMAEIEAGHTDVTVPVDDASEVGLLQAGFNRMAAGLQERERLRDLFGRHVGADVARHAEEAGVALGGELRHAAVLFVDVLGSTALAGELPPQEVVERLNVFFALVLHSITTHGGWVNKFEGDAALCVFGVPNAVADPAGRALAAARELCATLDRESPLPAGIGVSAGEVVAGNVGAAQRFEYTVIGDPVNEAARLSEVANGRHPRLLASGRALAQADPAEAAHWRSGEEVVLRGRRAPTELAAPLTAAPLPAP